jgi:hypothetical protein
MIEVKCQRQKNTHSLAGCEREQGVKCQKQKILTRRMRARARSKMPEAKNTHPQDASVSKE